MDMKRRRGLGVLHLLLYWTKGHKSEEVVPASRGRKKAEEIDSRSSKRNAIEAAIQKIEKEFGKGSVMRYGANQQCIKVEVVSSGSLALDVALGIGGYPRSRILKIFGSEMPTKATFVLHAIPKRKTRGWTRSALH